MKKLTAVLLSIIILFGCAACGVQSPAPSEAAEPAPSPAEEAAPAADAAPVELAEVNAEDNLIPGGFFDGEEKDEHWGVYTESGGVGVSTLVDGALQVNIDDPGIVAHAVQVYCDGFELVCGVEYHFSFDIQSSVPRTFEWRFQMNGGDYHAYYLVEAEEAGPEKTTVSVDFVMKDDYDPAPRLAFNVGDAKGAQGLGAHTLTIDNVCLVITDDSGAVAPGEELPTAGANLNQVGYRPGDTKIAVFRDTEPDTQFKVTKASTGAQVMSGKTFGSCSGGGSGETVSYGDFSELTEPGEYIVKADRQKSFVVTVADDVYDDLFRDVLKMLYLQRCGIELPEEAAGACSHSVCHTETATVYGGTETFEVSGGWHDAGDYGRYAVSGAKAAADLLLAYEMNPKAFGDDTGIPESGNGVPDVLDEARWELEWLMKVQRDDGAVYHKITGLNFDETVMADECSLPLFAMPVSATAAGDTAAVLFIGARLFGKYDKDFAAQCLERAMLSLSWAEEHAEDEGFVNPPDVLTGEYPDENALDEYLWALCEGFKTSADKEIGQKISGFDMSRVPVNGLGWADVTDYAYYAYLTSRKTDSSTAKLFKENLIAEADRIVATAAEDCYGSSIDGAYPWGSNMTIANNGVILLMAQKLVKGGAYTATARGQLDYLLGRNTTSYCFVSGYGTLYPEHPHHRPSQAAGEAPKGMLAGGPNSNLEDPYAQQTLKKAAPAACYKDSDQSYSTNEVAIYWNSPLVWLLSGLI